MDTEYDTIAMVNASGKMEIKYVAFGVDIGGNLQKCTIHIYRLVTYTEQHTYTFVHTCKCALANSLYVNHERFVCMRI